jgi:hypothetical protein
MRVLHILDHSLPLHSGYAFRTASILREQRALGWETMQLTTPRQGPPKALVERIDGIEFHRTPPIDTPLSRLPAGTYLSEMRATAKRIAQIVRAQRPDVLHPHSPVLNALPALWVGHRYRIPVVYELRALWEDAAVDHGSTYEGSARYRFSRALETFALSRADQITTICEGLRSEIISRGVLPARVTVIPNAVDTNTFRPESTPDEGLKHQLGLVGATVIGFAGSFYAYEGLDLLIAAVEALVPRRPELRVLLVGGGPQEGALRELVARAGLDKVVLFTGRVPHADVQRYYDLIDVLAYPRHRMRLTEIVTPLKPLEAMAQGRLFVASDVGGHKELVRDGETGFLFAADQVEALVRAIEHVLAIRTDWPRIKAAARKFVEKERTWAMSVARYADVYGRLVTPTRFARAA